MKHEAVVTGRDGQTFHVAVIPPQYASCKADPAEVPSRPMTAEAAQGLEDELVVGARVVVATTARSMVVAVTRVLGIPGAIGAVAYLASGVIVALIAGGAALAFVVSRGIPPADRPRIVEIIDAGSERAPAGPEEVSARSVPYRPE